jgi:phosphatidylglycerol:prolipoprotein diacylglycerol transferase
MFDHVIHWSFNPILFSIGPLHLRWYGLIWALAFIFGQYFVTWIYRRENRDMRGSEYILTYGLFGTVIGARLGHCLFYDPGFYLTHPIAILKMWEGGMASHGGAIGLLVAMWLYTRRFPVPSYMWLIDRMAIPATVGGALIRIANFLGSDIIGNPTSGTWGVIFDAVDQIPRHPVQLYEAVAYLLIFVLMLAVYLRKGVRTPDGLLTGMFMLLVFAARFGLEFFKTPQAVYEANFSITVGQWLSVPFMMAGIYLIVMALRASRQSGAQNAAS